MSACNPEDWVWAQSGAKGIPMRVLLIEDRPTTASYLGIVPTMLTTEGFNVYSAGRLGQGFWISESFMITTSSCST